MKTSALIHTTPRHHEELALLPYILSGAPFAIAYGLYLIRGDFIRKNGSNDSNDKNKNNQTGE